jgi:tRNA (uracil-5-)-methyltransferase TRM9
MDIKECYTQIASSFSGTRFTVWNKVKVFLDEIPNNALIGDIGCGNGKNMLYRKDELNYEGMDLCPEFIKICQERGLNVRDGNILNIPFTNNYFDYVICIAVIHHLDKREDRIKAISELLRITKPEGKLLIYVWSFNQYETNEKRKFTQKDEMVPFYDKISKLTFYRYYHLYDMDELISEVKSISEYKFKIEKSFNDKNNECIILIKK